MKKHIGHIVAVSGCSETWFFDILPTSWSPGDRDPEVESDSIEYYVILCYTIEQLSRVQPYQEVCMLVSFHQLCAADA